MTHARLTFSHALRLSMVAVAFLTAASYGLFGAQFEAVSAYTHVIVGVCAIAAAVLAFVRIGRISLDDDRCGLPLAAIFSGHWSLLAAFKGAPFNPGAFADWYVPAPEPAALDAGPLVDRVSAITRDLGDVVHLLAHAATPLFSSLVLALAILAWWRMPGAGRQGENGA